VCSPARAAVETAAALGLAATVDPGLADWHLGEWRGRALDEIAAAHPAELAAWLAAPDAAPHGGESLTALLARVAGWLAGAGLSVFALSTFDTDYILVKETSLAAALEALGKAGFSANGAGS